MAKSANSYIRIEPQIKVQAEKHPIDISMLSTEDLHEELEKGYADLKAERTREAKAVFADIRKDYGL